MEQKIDKKFRLNFHSYNIETLDLFTNSLSKILKQQNVPFKGPILMPVNTKSLTLIRSVFIYKRSKEHFCMKIHRRMFEILEKDLNLVMFDNVLLPSQIKLTVQRVK